MLTSVLGEFSSDAQTTNSYMPRTAIAMPEGTFPHVANIATSTTVPTGPTFASTGSTQTPQIVSYTRTTSTYRVAMPGAPTGAAVRVRPRIPSIGPTLTQPDSLAEHTLSPADPAPVTPATIDQSLADEAAAQAASAEGGAWYTRAWLWSAVGAAATLAGTVWIMVKTAPSRP